MGIGGSSRTGRDGPIRCFHVRRGREGTGGGGLVCIALGRWEEAFCILSPGCLLQQLDVQDVLRTFDREGWRRKEVVAAGMACFILRDRRKGPKKGVNCQSR